MKRLLRLDWFLGLIAFIICASPLSALEVTWSENLSQCIEITRISKTNLKILCVGLMGRQYDTTDEVISKFRNKHGDRYDYSRVQYVNSVSKVEIICPDHMVVVKLKPRFT